MAAVKATFTPPGGSPITLGDNTAGRGASEKWLEALTPNSVNQAVETKAAVASAAKFVAARGNFDFSLSLELSWAGDDVDAAVLALAQSLVGTGHLDVTYAGGGVGVLGNACFLSLAVREALEVRISFTLTFVGSAWVYTPFSP